MQVSPSTEQPRRKFHCAGKVKYVRGWEAKQAAVKSRSYYGFMRKYRCSICGYWHIGHRRKDG